MIGNIKTKRGTHIQNVIIIIGENFPNLEFFKNQECAHRVMVKKNVILNTKFDKFIAILLNHENEKGVIYTKVRV